MANFEDIVRDRILQGTIGEIPEELELDRNDIEIFASMVYALLRAGARREGQEGFQAAFSHFMDSPRFGGVRQPVDPTLGISTQELGLTENYDREAELESIRIALIGAVERFSSEARALHVYFNAVDNDGIAPEDATDMAVAVLREDSGDDI